MHTYTHTADEKLADAVFYGQQPRKQHPVTPTQTCGKSLHWHPSRLADLSNILSRCLALAWHTSKATPFFFVGELQLLYLSVSEHFVFSNKEGTATYNFRSTSSWCVLSIALLVTFHPFHCILVPECMPVAWIGSLLATNKLSYLVLHSKDAPQINRAHARTCTCTHTHAKALQRRRSWHK